MKINLFMPGRLCLFGEHSDWAGAYRKTDKTVLPGKCIIAGTDQGLYATSEQIASGFQILQIDSAFQKSSNQLLPSDSFLLEKIAKAGGFNSYAAGAASVLLQRFPGLSLKLDVFKRDLPIKKGLSSSAAISVLVVRAFNKVHSLGLSVEEEMEIAYQGELLTGSRCGRMDQACAYGKGSTLLTFDSNNMEVELLTITEPLYFLIVDLHGKKDTIKILKDLNASFCNGDVLIRKALGEMNQFIVSEAYKAIENGDAELLGKLMKDAQNIFDDMVAPSCILELAAPKLHEILCSTAVRKYSFGGKGVGSQGDGTAQFICKGKSEREFLRKELERNFGLTCFALTLEPTDEF